MQLITLPPGWDGYPDHVHVPGDAGIRLIALGGVPGTFRPSAWTELGGPWPVAQSGRRV
jgi:hypothetical protein